MATPTKSTSRVQTRTTPGKSPKGEGVGAKLTRKKAVAFTPDTKGQASTRRKTGRTKGKVLFATPPPGGKAKGKRASTTRRGIEQARRDMDEGPGEEPDTDSEMGHNHDNDTDSGMDTRHENDSDSEMDSKHNGETGPRMNWEREETNQECTECGHHHEECALCHTCHDGDEYCRCTLCKTGEHDAKVACKCRACGKRHTVLQPCKQSPSKKAATKCRECKGTYTECARCKDCHHGNQRCRCPQCGTHDHVKGEACWCQKCEIEHSANQLCEDTCHVCGGVHENCQLCGECHRGADYCPCPQCETDHEPGRPCPCLNCHTTHRLGYACPVTDCGECGKQHVICDDCNRCHKGARNCACSQCGKSHAPGRECRCKECGQTHRVGYDCPTDTCEVCGGDHGDCDKCGQCHQGEQYCICGQCGTGEHEPDAGCQCEQCQQIHKQGECKIQACKDCGGSHALCGNCKQCHGKESFCFCAQCQNSDHAPGRQCLCIECETTHRATERCRLRKMKLEPGEEKKERPVPVDTRPVESRAIRDVGHLVKSIGKLKDMRAAQWIKTVSSKRHSQNWSPQLTLMFLEEAGDDQIKSDIERFYGKGEHQSQEAIKAMATKILDQLTRATMTPAYKQLVKDNYTSFQQLEDEQGRVEELRPFLSRHEKVVVRMEEAGHVIHDKCTDLREALHPAYLQKYVTIPGFEEITDMDIMVAHLRNIGVQHQLTQQAEIKREVINGLVARDEVPSKNNLIKHRSTITSTSSNEKSTRNEYGIPPRKRQREDDNENDNENENEDEEEEAAFYGNDNGRKRPGNWGNKDSPRQQDCSLCGTTHNFGKCPMRKCFGCNELGHIASNCPRKKEVICFRCQKKGHYADKCPEGGSGREPHRGNNHDRHPDRNQRRASPDRNQRRASPDRNQRRASPDRNHRRSSPDRNHRRPSPDRNHRRPPAAQKGTAFADRNGQRLQQGVLTKTNLTPLGQRRSTLKLYSARTAEEQMALLRTAIEARNTDEYRRLVTDETGKVRTQYHKDPKTGEKREHNCTICQKDNHPVELCKRTVCPKCGEGGHTRELCPN
jgi:hypothetical protein